MTRTKKPETTTRFGMALLLAAAGWTGLPACDSDDEPQIRILTPTAGSTVSLDADMKVPFTISVNDFALKAPNQCNGDARCGTAHLNIDGNACNQPGLPYNAILGDGRFGQDFLIQADFSLCPSPLQLGSHTVTVSLRDPLGQVVSGDGGEPAQATISVVTTR